MAERSMTKAPARETFASRFGTLVTVIGVTIGLGRRLPPRRARPPTPVPFSTGDGVAGVDSQQRRQP